MTLPPLDNSNRYSAIFQDNRHESVPEPIKHLSPHYQHCALCRSPRVGWNKKWSDTISTVLCAGQWDEDV